MTRFSSGFAMVLIGLTGVAALGQTRPASAPATQNSQEVNYWLRKWEDELQKFSEAKATSQAASDRELGGRLITVANAFARAGKKDKAISFLEKAEALFSPQDDRDGNAEIVLAEGWFEVDRGRALAHLDKLRQKSAQRHDPSSSFQVAYTAARIGEWKLAQELIADDKDWQHWSFVTEIIANTLSQKDPAQAREFANKIMARSTQPATGEDKRQKEAMTRIAGTTLFKLGDFDQAVDTLRKLSDPTEKLKAFRSVALFHLANNDLSKARWALEGSSKLYDPKAVDPFVGYVLLTALARVGNSKQAQALSDKLNIPLLPIRDKQVLVALAMWNDNQKPAALDLVKQARDGAWSTGGTTTYPNEDFAEHCFRDAGPGALVLACDGQVKEALEFLRFAGVAPMAKEAIAEIIRQGKFAELREWVPTLQRPSDRFMVYEMILGDLLKSQP